jgi:allophanate hydrolase
MRGRERRRYARLVTRFAFYGTFTRGQPGHGNLAGARFLEEVRTAPRYRLFLLDGLPALVPTADGVELACELYEVPEELLVRLAEIEPPGWERAPLALSDGRAVEAFLASPELAVRGIDVSDHHGWAAYVRSVAYQTTSRPCQNAVPP